MTSFEQVCRGYWFSADAKVSHPCASPMSFQTSTSPIAPNASEVSTRFEVRTVWLEAAVRPYAWEIVNELTGEVVRRSSARFRKPGEAWAAGVLALDAG